LRQLSKEKETTRLGHTVLQLPPQNNNTTKEGSTEGERRRVSDCEQATRLLASTIRENKGETGSKEQQDNQNDTDTFTIGSKSGAFTPSTGTHTVVDAEWDNFSLSPDRTRGNGGDASGLFSTSPSVKKQNARTGRPSPTSQRATLSDTIDFPDTAHSSMTQILPSVAKSEMEAYKQEDMFIMGVLRILRDITQRIAQLECDSIAQREEWELRRSEAV